MKKTFLFFVTLTLIISVLGVQDLKGGDTPTRLFAASAGESRIYIGWRLSSDNPQTGYNVYRKDPGKESYTKLNKTPITGSTNFVDTKIKPQTAYQYQVRAVKPGGGESEPAQVAVTSGTAVRNVYLRINGICQGTNRGKAKTGDIDGDSLPDMMVVTRPVSKNGEEIHHQKFGNLHVKVYYNNGKLACDIDMGETELKSRTAWTFWDLDGDQRDELIGVMKSQPGSKQYSLYVIDPTGKKSPDYKVLAKTDVPSTSDHTTRYKTISIAYFDGKTPYILYGSGHQQGQTMNVCAYKFHKPGTISETWNYEVKIINETLNDPFYRPEGCKTNCVTNISSSHQFEVADIDKDEKDEAFYGTYTFNANGFKGFWRGHQWSHSDVVRVGYIRPGQTYQDVCFWLEQSDLGVHLTDYKGKEIWKKKDCDKLCHAHEGWVGDVITEIKGQEIWTFYKEPVPPHNSCSVLHDCHGNKVYFGDGRAKNLGFGTVDWDGKLPLEVIHNSTVQQFKRTHEEEWQLAPISPPQALGSGDAFAMDIIGDYREEILSFDLFNGSLRLTIYTNLQENSSRKVSPCINRQYMQRHRWSGH